MWNHKGKRPETQHGEINFLFKSPGLRSSSHPAPEPAEEELLGSLPFHFHDTLGLLESLPEAMTTAQNVHNYVLHMSHQTGISLLVLSIYINRNWKTYNERLCFTTSREAPSCQGYFFPLSILQFDVEYNQVPRLYNPCTYDPIPPRRISDCSISDYCQLKHK